MRTSSTIVDVRTREMVLPSPIRARRARLRSAPRKAPGLATRWVAVRLLGR